MLLTKTVSIRIIGVTREHYSQKMGIELHADDIVEVPVEFLNDKSEKLVDVICDYCGKKYTTKWYGYLKSRKNFPKDSCPSCRSAKTRDVCMLKYGVDNPAKAESVRQKYKETCLEKYSVDNSMKAEQTKKKVKQTNIERYGTACSLQNDDVKKKSEKTLLEKYGAETFMGSEKGQKIVRATMQEKYGVDKPFQNKDIKAKAVATITERYGECGPLGNEEIREKIAKTVSEKYGNIETMVESGLHRCGTAYVSKTQMKLCELYGGKLNKNIGRYFGDIVFEDKKIVIEYDGGGHDLAVKTGRLSQKEFDEKELKRQECFINNGYKIGRIVDKHGKKLSDSEYLEIKNTIFNELKDKDIFIYNIE